MRALIFFLLFFLRPHARAGVSVKALGLPIYPRRHQFPLTQRNDACPTFCEKQRDQSNVPAAIRGMHALSIMSVPFFVVLLVVVVVDV